MFRLLIADDEDLVRRGLTALIERDAPEVTIVGAAVDGEDALDVAGRTAPDVVLTDIRMPGMSGLDLIQHLRASQPHLRCIILSGYDEFDYARRAVSLGVTEYLLKPVDPDELLGLLKRMHGEIDAERRERRLHDTYVGITVEQSARLLLDGHQVDEEVLAACFPAAPAWGLVLVQGELSGTSEGRQTLRAACQAAMEQAVVVEDAYGYLCMLFPLQTMESSSVATVARQVHQALRVGQYRADVTAARAARGLAEIGKAHSEAVEATEYHVMGVSDEPLLSWELLARPAERWPALPPARGQALLDAVAQGREADAEREARSFMTYAREHVPQGALRALWFEIIVLLVNRVQQIGVRADALLEPGQDPRDLLAGFADAGRQEEQLVRLATRAARECRQLRTQHSPRATIQELQEYIAGHTGDDLTIAALAQRMHLNAKYLGEVFKQSTGESLGDYVVRARMKRAKELLATTSLKVYAIAEQVGYRDPKHFAVMFRAVSGKLPSEYREQRDEQDELPE